ncbi:MAG TPA: flagellin [Verrucomicrobiae bacterium]|nr:flagellin [Verrucomicrobiae bacterium]
MRVTSNTFPTALVNQLTDLNTRQNRLQTQAATGQRLQFPEDDPTAMRRVLDLQNESSSVGQYQNNITQLQQQLTVSYSAMKSLKGISDRASEIATLADGTKSPQDLQTYATELNQLIQQGVDLANSKFGGNFLFGGTKSSAAPYTATLDANGNVTGVAYNGNTQTSQTEIAEGVTFTAQTIGENTSGAGPRGLITDSRVGADLFNHLISLRQHLAVGDTTSIANTDRANLAKDEDNIIFQFGTNGALQSRLDAASSVTSDRSFSIETLVSKEADADLSETLVRLGQTQNAYKAALQSGATILGQSLLDYIH